MEESGRYAVGYKNFVLGCDARKLCRSVFLTRETEAVLIFNYQLTNLPNYEILLSGR